MTILVSRESDQQLIARIGMDNIASREKKRQRRNMRIAAFFLGPAIFLVGLMFLIPVVANIYFSLTKWKRFKGFGEYVGLDNYERLPNSPLFADALINTTVWVAASVIFPISIGLGLALFLRGFRFENAVKNIVFFILINPT